MTAVTTYGAKLTHYAGGDYNLAGVDLPSNVHAVRDYHLVASADQALNSLIGLAVIPSGAILRDILIVNEALDTNVSPTLTIDVGLYTIDGSGVLTAVAATCYASASTLLQSAHTGMTTAIDPAIITADLRHKPAFINAGLSADPGTNYVIAIKIHAASATAATTAKLGWDINFIAN